MCLRRICRRLMCPGIGLFRRIELHLNMRVRKVWGYISLAISSESESSDENEQVSFETNEGENDVKSRSTITEESKEGRVLKFNFWV